MKFEITQHAMERSLERLGLTGVELYKFLNKHIKEKHLRKK